MIEVKDNILQKSHNGIFPKSPLRYPGGKSRAVKIILGLIPSDTESLVSPFIGGASVEIALASLGVNVIGFDIFDPLVNFWSSLLTDPCKLGQMVRKFFPLSRDKYYKLQKTNTDGYESGAIFYVLNRSSFSGSTMSGGMSLGHQRFTERSISYMERFSMPNMKVYKGDFRITIPKFESTLLYLDPPYFISYKLYGRNGDTHRYFDHESLCTLLKDHKKWVLSYNDCAEVREMYKNFRIMSPQWKYGMSSNKSSCELLIVSDYISDLIQISD